MPSDKKRPTGLTPAQAISEMFDILKVMQGEPDREQLKAVDSDTAFERGYETALLDYTHLTTHPSDRVVRRF